MSRRCRTGPQVPLQACLRAEAAGMVLLLAERMTFERQLPA